LGLEACLSELRQSSVRPQTRQEDPATMLRKTTFDATDPTQTTVSVPIRKTVLLLRPEWKGAKLQGARLLKKMTSLL